MQLIVYPNPNAGKFYLELEGSKSESQIIELHNSSGEIVHQSKLERDKSNLVDLTGIDSGNYSLHLICDRFEIQKKICIQNPNDAPSNAVLLARETESIS